MVSVTSASHYVTSASRYQSRSSMYILGLIPRNSTELAEAFPIATLIKPGSKPYNFLCLKRAYSNTIVKQIVEELSFLE